LVPESLGDIDQQLFEQLETEMAAKELKNMGALEVVTLTDALNVYYMNYNRRPVKRMLDFYYAAGTKDPARQIYRCSR